MSSLAQTYALQCAVKLDPNGPTTEEAFYPLDHPLDKVILVHAFGGGLQNHNGQLVPTFPAKIYAYYSEVVELLKPIVEPLGYRFYQIGAPNEPGVRGIEHLQGKTTYHQCVYLVKRAALLVGNDSMWAHERGSFKGAMVIAYGSTDMKNHGPYWQDKEKTTLIESHRFGQKPSYQSQEHPKTIDTIRPEQVANAALKLLGLPPILRQTLFIGPDYNQSVCEIVPNCVPAPSLNIPNPILRFDYHFDAALVAQNLAVRRCHIITDREFNLNLLANRQQVALIKVQLSDAISVAWVRQLKRVGVPLQFFTLETDEAKLKRMRLDLFDIEVYFDTHVFPAKEAFEKDAAKWLHEPGFKPDYARLQFRTLKVLVSDGKIYPSNAHRLAGIAGKSAEDNGGAVIDDPMFWREQSHHSYFYA